MKYFTGLAWVIAIITVAAVASYWKEINWAWTNRETIKQAADATAGLKQAGVLK